MVILFLWSDRVDQNLVWHKINELCTRICKGNLRRLHYYADGDGSSARGNRAASFAPLIMLTAAGDFCAAPLTSAKPREQSTIKTPLIYRLLNNIVQIIKHFFYYRIWLFIYSFQHQLK